MSKLHKTQRVQKKTDKTIEEQRLKQCIVTPNVLIIKKKATLSVEEPVKVKEKLTPAEPSIIPTVIEDSSTVPGKGVDKKEVRRKGGMGSKSLGNKTDGGKKSGGKKDKGNIRKEQKKSKKNK